MAIKFKGATLSNVIFNGVSLGKIIYNSVVVWIEELILTFTGGSWLQSNVLSSTYLATGSTVSANKIIYNPSHDGYRAAAYQTVLFDVTNFSKLVITGTDVVAYNYDDPIYHSTVIQLLNSSGTVVKTLYSVIDQKISKNTTANISINNDISALKGNHRIRIHVGTWGASYYPKTLNFSVFKLQ